MATGTALARPRLEHRRARCDVAAGDGRERGHVAVDDLEQLAQVVDRGLHGVEEGDRAVDDGHDPGGVEHREQLGDDASTISRMIQSLAVVRIVSHRLLELPWMNSQTAVMPRSCTSLMNVHAPVSWSSAPRICRRCSGPIRSPSFVQSVSAVTPSTWMTSVMIGLDRQRRRRLDARARAARGTASRPALRAGRSRCCRRSRLEARPSSRRRRSSGTRSGRS